MSMNTTLHLEMVEKAAQFLTRAPQATVPEAMRVARFSEDDIANLNIQKQIICRLPGRKKPTAASSVVTAPVSSVACSLMTTGVSDITSACDNDVTCPPPKCIRVRKTAPAAMKDRIENLKQKRHFSTAHKEATRLYAQECTKSGGGGMSTVQVAEHIKKKYCVGLSAETICREVKKGHVGTSPMKMGPVRRVPRCNYRHLCDASASFTAINQLNKCAGLNVCNKMIQNIAKTLGTSQKAAAKILQRVV
jgi:hypothetical protein